jgi:plasmid maintenance system killer protein
MRISDGKLRRFWRTGHVKGMDPMSVERLQELLSALDAATRPEDMAQPGWDFHPLKGQKKGHTRVLDQEVCVSRKSSFTPRVFLGRTRS